MRIWIAVVALAGVWVAGGAAFAGAGTPGGGPPAEPAGSVGAGEDPWLERTLMCSSWPRALLRATVEREGSRRFLLVDGKDMKSQERFRWRLPVPAGDRELRPSGEGPLRIMRPAAVSPDGRYRAEARAGEQIVLTLADRMKEEKKTVLRRAYTGDWSIGSVAWSPRGDAFYFDNAGAVACIWRYDVRGDELTKIVPAHEAFSPAPFTAKGTVWVGFIESPWQKTSCARIARPLGPEQKNALARGSVSVQPLAGVWRALERRDGGGHRVRILGGPRPRLAFDIPGGETFLQVDAAVATGAHSYSFVVRTKAGGLREVAELLLDDKRNRARITRFAGVHQPETAHYVAGPRPDQGETRRRRPSD